MRARLFCRTGEMVGSTYEFADDVVIGRSGANDIVLHASIISEKHAAIRFRGDGCFLEDLQSANGTELDGTRITEAVRLQDLHVITFAGTFDFFFQLMEAEPMSSRDAPGAPPREASDSERGTRLDMEPPGLLPDLEGAAAADRESPARDDAAGTRFDVEAFAPLPDLQDPDQTEEPESPARDDAAGTRFDVEAFAPLPDLEDPAEAGGPAGAGPSPASDPTPAGAGGVADEDAAALPRLSVSFSDGRVEDHPLRVGANVIGRSLDCDVAILEPSLSRQHARITVIDTSGSSFQPWKFEIEDLGSSNGTAVNGEVISGVATVGPGSEIVLGPEVNVRIGIP